MVTLFYEKADRTSQWYGDGNATVAPDKVLWHSTETAGGWPGYSGGASAPNLTYEPWQHKWRQHFPLNGTSRALRNGRDAAGNMIYSTNRQGVCQVEVSCYCDPAQFATGKGINRLDAQAYDDMGAFAEFMHHEWGIPLFTGVAFLPYPDSYGVNGVRLSRDQFTAYRGHLDHMHAPDNDHGDAGTMDVPRIVAANPTTIKEPDMFLVFGPGGAAIAGPGYWHNLNGEEYQNALLIPGIKQMNVNQRQWDVLGAVCLHGTTADNPELATLAQVAELSDEDLAQIATWVNDELARRQAS